MPEVTFSHPRIKPDLHVSVKPDQVTWAYGLNTAVYPTYGGEVVQILSVYFDDMTISGTVGSYSELEAIYIWFLKYMQDATQGRFGPSFDQHPVQFNYYERGWQFAIWPKALPAFKYGRDVVAPTWKVVAAVKEPDATFKQQITQFATFNAAHKGQFEFGTATADFGTTGDLVNNPWASPDGAPKKKGQTVNQYVSQQSKNLGDNFIGFLQSYIQNDLSKLPQFPDLSKSANPASQNSTTKAKKGKVKH